MLSLRHILKQNTVETDSLVVRIMTSSQFLYSLCKSVSSPSPLEDAMLQAVSFRAQDFSPPFRIWKDALGCAGTDRTLRTYVSQKTNTQWYMRSRKYALAVSAGIIPLRLSPPKTNTDYAHFHSR